MVYHQDKMFDYLVDANFVIQRLGLESAAPAIQQQLVGQVQTVLDKRMGEQFQSELSPQEWQQFDQLFEQAGDEDHQAAISWLEQRFPDYRARFDAELQVVLGELQQTLQRNLPS